MKKLIITTSLFLISSGLSAPVFAKTYKAGAFENSDQQYCREYSQNIKIGNANQSGYGTACRQPDGSWQLFPNNEAENYQQPAQNIVYVVRDDRVFYRPPSSAFEVNIFKDLRRNNRRNGHWKHGNYYRDGFHESFRHNYGYR